MHRWLAVLLPLAVAAVASLTSSLAAAAEDADRRNGTGTGPEGGRFGNLHYMVLASREAQLDSVYTVSFALLTGETIRSARASIITLTMAENSRNLTTEAVWTSDLSQPGVDSVTLSMKLDNDAAIDLSGSYRLTVQLTGSGGSIYRNETSVSLKAAGFLTFVQTDKAVYQPGQTVKFRVVTLDQALRPVFANFTVLVKDARGNLVDRFRHEPPADQSGRSASSAVMQGQFDLADLPNLGTWRIEASGGRGQQQTKTFTVEQYVLPKFSVEVQPPEFVQLDDVEFRVTATVRYTYRQAVQGRLRAEIGPWNPCQQCKNKYDLVKTFEVDLNGTDEGRATFAFPLGEWRDALAERVNVSGSFDWMSTFNAKAFIQFTEKFSGVIKTAEATFTIYRKKYQLSVQIPDVPYFLPGMKIPIQITLNRPDGKPYTGNLSSDVQLTLQFTSRGKSKSLELYRGGLNPAPSGTGVSLLIAVPDYADFTPITYTGAILSESGSESSAGLNPFLAVTDDFVLAGVHSDENGVRLRVNQSSGIKLAFATVLSRGRIHKWTAVDVSNDSGLGPAAAATALTIQRDSLASLIPSFSFVVLGVVETGEVVASYADYSVPSVTGKLGLSTNLTGDTGEPQEAASIRVSGEPNSFVFLTGIDASVNLIRTGQDILESTVTEALRGAYHSGGRFGWARTYTTATVLQRTNLLLLTDGFYYEETDTSPFFRGGDFERLFSVSSMADSKIESSGSMPSSPEKSQKRQFFPETMLWTMVATDSSGQANETVQLPDTITSWDVTAFGISEQSAIQTVSQALKVTTFKRFFVRPVLPHSVVRGEALVLRVLVFNYMAQGMTANVTLAPSRAFAAEPLTGQAGVRASDGGGLSAEVAVGPSGVGLAVFLLRPTEVTEAAEVAVRARAVWTGGRAEVDEVARTLPVLPEGRTVRRTKTALLSLAGNRTEAKASLSIEWPSGEAVDADGQHLVAGSQLLSVSVIGDAMGPAMDGIGGLLRTPHGCGEQNMVDFAPAVFVFRYLSSSAGPEAEGFRNKALGAMRTGYQRELAFRRHDGSYSAFGDADRVGSAWLTAFVLSVFAQAASFIPVDPETISGASVAFVLGRQDAAGRFSEPEGGRVLDSGLQGTAGAASIGMSAFVCSALLDVWEAVEAHPALRTPGWSERPVAPALALCVRLFGADFAQRPGDFDTRDLALTSHFLWRLRRTDLWNSSTDASATLTGVWAAFNARAVSEDGGTLRHWEVTSPGRFGTVRPSEEVTAYGVLSAILAQGPESALPALRWLTGRQNDRGGFSDTQSTVVAVRALAAFATATAGPNAGPTRARVELTILPLAQAVAFDIKPDTRRVLQRRLVGRGSAASQVGDIDIRATGSGLVLATAAWQFNLRDSERRFLTANWNERSGISVRLGVRPSTPSGAAFAFSVCAKASAGEGMYILRLGCPSGYLPVDYTPSGGASGLQLVEAGADQLVFYFNQITENEVCVQSAWKRDVPVLNAGPQMITVQKYYQPEVSNIAFFLDPELQSVTQCQACQDCPGCGLP